LVVVSDMKLTEHASGLVTGYVADVVSYSDYPPLGHRYLTELGHPMDIGMVSRDRRRMMRCMVQASLILLSFGSMIQDLVEDGIWILSTKCELAIMLC
jgi:hypothetical protein